MDSATFQNSSSSETNGTEAGSLAFVTGGARSGKSAFATRYALETAGTRIPAIVATGESVDPEFAARIERHKKDRGGSFATFEEALAVADAFARASLHHRVVVLDCVTTWLGNVFFHRPDEAETFALAEIGRLLDSLARGQARLVVISNELGMGLVPESAESRKYRDLHGIVNQRLAHAASEAWLLVSGLPLRLK